MKKWPLSLELISSFQWYDTLLSTFVGSEPVSEVTRWNSKTKAYEKVACPKVVSVYNKHGWRGSHELIGLYRINMVFAKVAPSSVLPLSQHNSCQCLATLQTTAVNNSWSSAFKTDVST